MRGKRNDSRGKANFFLAAEFLFILLPFIVSGIVFANKGNLGHLFSAPDWSLAASVLIGQSVIKFISGMLAKGAVYKANWERVAFGISFLIVVCLVPSLAVLVLVLNAEGSASLGLAISQVIVFALGIGVFFAFGASGETLMRFKEDGE